MLEGILGAFFKSIISSITAWFEKEQLEEAKSLAAAKEKQLESIKNGKSVEKAIKESIKKVKKDISISDWNNGLLLLCVCLPFFSGCFRHYVTADQYRPVPPLIERPQIPLKPAEWTDREIILRDYALKLEAAYKAIIDDAIAHNNAAGLTIPE